MANYEGMVRTNYFRIKSEKEFMDAVSGLSGECSVETTVREIDGKLYGWFGSYSSLDYYDEETEDWDWDGFINKMQKVIADDDAMLITEIGNEKLRYLVGSCVVVTSKEVKYIDISTVGINAAREMLNNNDWDTENNY